MRRRSSMSQNPTTRPTLGAAPDTTGTISQIHSDANQTASFVHPRFRVRTVWRGDHAGDGWNGLRALGEKQGRHKACPYGSCWGFEHRSLSQPFVLSTRVGHMKGGVAGGIPPHKGGPKARPPKCEERVKRREAWATQSVLPESVTGADLGLVATGGIREFTPTLGWTLRAIIDDFPSPLCYHPI